MGLAKGRHVFAKFKMYSVFFKIFPIQPGNLIVLTIGIVISVLGVQKFIP